MVKKGGGGKNASLSLIIYYFKIAKKIFFLFEVIFRK
jgi:hypothetical protein